ncbi:hypothetical protein AOQ84DRAFT_321525 [Glonium stellatum]|uniref:Uncharacterized protein n=1 Tax=Glonium stellatum TaxID=574774 RepID=A0A8E2JR10_9PEZI|nr:hypothetical protein AOQ84DRAFT_321525 [Glonium stellatum]
MASFSAHSISRADFDDVLARYQDVVPAKLQDLDKLRFESIPQKLAQRKKGSDVFLEKDEVENLVEWKLKHGTFRPKLFSLVSSNLAGDIRDTTASAFKQYEANRSCPADAAKILIKLKGIGPATASLLLSVYEPDAVAFFSDELFRWLSWKEGKGKGWDRKIGYTMKEYQSLCDEVEKVRARLGVPVVEMEKVAWVLGGEGADLNAVEAGKKRKAEESKQASEPLRRSNRSGTSEAQSGPPDPEPPSKRTKGVETPSTPPPKAPESAPKAKQLPPSNLSSEAMDDPIERCFRKGPNGSPTYDRLGYELDYHAIAASRRRPRKRSGKKYDEMLERSQNEEKRKAMIMGMDQKDVSALSLMAWNDRISRDLGIPYHKVEMKHFEEWYAKGLRAQPGEFRAKNISPEEQERINNLALGSAFRK